MEKETRLKKRETQQGHHQRTWEVMNMTVGEYTKDKGMSKFKNNIRLLARSWFPAIKNKNCANCNYDKHVEYAHVKAITKFDNNALLSEINSLENLIPLCPNCHWEYDNGILDISALVVKLDIT